MNALMKQNEEDKNKIEQFELQISRMQKENTVYRNIAQMDKLNFD